MLDYDYCLVWKLCDQQWKLHILLHVLFPPKYVEKLSPFFSFQAVFPLASSVSSRRVSREMSECGQVVITGALIFPLQVLKRSENNLHSPPVKVLRLHCRSVLMLSGNQVKTHKRETLPYCKLHELNQIQVRNVIAVIFYKIIHVFIAIPFTVL